MPRYLCYCPSSDEKEEDAKRVNAKDEREAAVKFVAMFDGEAVEYPPARLVMVKRVNASGWLLFETQLRAQPVYSANLMASVV